MLRKAAIDLACPIDPDHDDNAGLVFALLNLPGLTGGGRWPDATGRTGGHGLQRGIWESTPYGPGVRRTSGNDAGVGQAIDAGTAGWSLEWIAFDGSGGLNRIIPIGLNSTGFNGVFRFVGLEMYLLLPNGSGAIAWSNVFLEDNRFHHYLITVAAPGGGAVNARVYRDGSQVGTGTTNSGLLAPTLLTVGGSPSSVNGWPSAIPRVQFYSRTLDDGAASRLNEYSLRPLHENPTLRKLRNWAFWDLGAAGPGTVSANANIVQAVGSLLASAAVLIGAASTPEQSQTAAGVASITVGADATASQSQQAEASASVTVGAAASLEQSQSLAAGASIIVGAGVEASQGGTLTATATASESVDTGAGFPWLVAGLGYW